jgi:GAF domain-containing protein
MERIVGAMVPLFGVTGGSVLLLDAGSALRHAATTNSGADRLELAQEETGEGPCIDALVNEMVVQSRDVLADGRWRRLAERLGDGHIRAVLGMPVHVGGTAVGSLNVYVDRPYDWDDSDLEAMRAFNNVVEDGILAALLANRHEHLVDQLQEALDHRVFIERAVGLLMGRHQLDAVSAFDRLRRAARSQRRKVVDVATALLDGKPVPDL